MKKYLQQKYIIITLLVFLAACGTGVNLFSEQDEVKLGEQFDEEIHNNPDKYPIYKGNPVIKDYIRKEIFHHIVNSSPVKSEDVYKYQVEIIDNDSTLNAFAVPGGFIYIYTGLLKYLESEAALAGVLAHEIAHVERRHATQRITNAYGLQLLANLALGNNPAQVSVIVANLLSGLTLLANSRSAEEESDKYAVLYLADTKFYAGGVKFFFEHMKADGKVSESSDVATFFSTHPDPIDRISTTENRLREKGIEILPYTSNGPGIFRNEYQKNLKSKL